MEPIYTDCPICYGTGIDENTLFACMVCYGYGQLPVLT